LNDRRVQDAPLDHGDFIRLGSQTLLFVMVSAPSRPSAPRVESTSRIEAEGVRSSERLWIAPQLELLESARARGDAAEVQRRLALVVRDVTARVEDGRMDATTLDVLGRDIVRAAVAIGSGATLSWLIDVHRRVGHLPGPSTTTALAACPRILVADAMQAIDRLLESASDQGFSRDLLETLQTKSAR
jgi:hypothetical protein